MLCLCGASPVDPKCLLGWHHLAQAEGLDVRSWCCWSTPADPRPRTSSSPGNRCHADDVLHFLPPSP
ncbi:unnamed protein product [Arctogadus glacialis]